MALRGYP